MRPSSVHALRAASTRTGKQRRPATFSSSGCSLPVVAGRNCCQTWENQQGTLGARTLPTQTSNLQTDVRSSSVVCVWDLHRSRNSFVIQFRDKFVFVPCLCVTPTHTRAATDMNCFWKGSQSSASRHLLSLVKSRYAPSLTP